MAKKRKLIKNFLTAIRKRLALFIMCLFIVVSCWAILFKHYTTNNARRDFISRMENSLFDLRFLNRGRVKAKAKIGILAIDEKSIEQFGRWPFSRKYYAQALRHLKNLGVQWIGFDALFGEAEQATINDLKVELDSLEKSVNNPTQLPTQVESTLGKIENFKKVSPGDREFAQGVKDVGNVILGYFYFRNRFEVEEGGRKDIAFAGLEDMNNSAIDTVIFPEGKDLSSYESLAVQGIAANIPVIAAEGKNFAFFSNEADPDAIIRWVTLVRNVNGKLMPSLSLKLAALASDRTILVEFGNLGIESIDLVSNKDESDILKIPIDPLGAGRVLLNHRGPSQTYPHVSLADAYNNNFTAEQKEWLKGSSLLVGMTAIGINDQRPNPFDPTLDGVEIHATAADNILSRDLMSRPKTIYSTELLIILLIGIIFSPILIFSKAAYSGLVALIFVISYYFFDKVYWFNKGIWAYIGMPYIELFLLYVGIIFYKYMTEEREKKKVRGAFSYYLSPEVIEEVLEEPENLQLGGTKKNLTVFFFRRPWVYNDFREFKPGAVMRVHECLLYTHDANHLKEQRCAR